MYTAITDAYDITVAAAGGKPWPYVSELWPPSPSHMISCYNVIKKRFVTLLLPPENHSYFNKEMLPHVCSWFFISFMQHVIYLLVFIPVKSCIGVHFLGHFLLFFFSPFYALCAFCHLLTTIQYSHRFCIPSQQTTQPVNQLAIQPPSRPVCLRPSIKQNHPFIFHAASICTSTHLLCHLFVHCNTLAPVYLSIHPPAHPSSAYPSLPLSPPFLPSPPPSICIPIHLATYSPFHLPIHPSTFSLTFLPFHPSIHPSIYPASRPASQPASQPPTNINLYIHLSSLPSIYSSTAAPYYLCCVPIHRTKPSSACPSIHLYFHPSIHPSIHPPTHSSVHPWTYSPFIYRFTHPTIHSSTYSS